MHDHRRVSPRLLGRLIGALYLYIMVAAMFAEAFVRDRLVVAGDPEATARSLAAHQVLWRWGVAADLSTTLCDVAVAALMFVLLRPAGPALSLTAAAFRLVYAAAMAASAALLVAPMALLASTQGALPFAASQSHALVMQSLRLHETGFQIALAPFGAHLLLVGLLVARSGFLPRLLGAALALAGGCYLAHSFIGLLSPGLSARLFPWILLPGFLAEAALTLWLLIAGVDETRWRDAALRAAR